MNEEIGIMRVGTKNVTDEAIRSQDMMMHDEVGNLAGMDQVTNMQDIRSDAAQRRQEILRITLAIEDGENMALGGLPTT